MNRTALKPPRTQLDVGLNGHEPHFPLLGYNVAVVKVPTTHEPKPVGSDDGGRPRPVLLFPNQCAR